MVTLRVRSMVWFATGVALTLLATVLVMQTWRVDAAPGDTDSTFVPTSPCRLFDYRPAPHTVGPRSAPLGAGDTHIQQVTGSNGDCTGPLAIPGDAVAVAMNVTAVSPTAQSNLRVFPADVAKVPTVSNLNFSAGQKPVPNKVDVKLSPDGKIKLFNAAGSVSVVGDVVGYYTKSSLTDIETRLSALETATAAQPFVATDVDAQTKNNISTSASTPTEVASVTVVAPADGTVSAYASAWAGFTFPDVGGEASGVQAATCQITTNAKVFTNFGGPYAFVGLEEDGGHSVAATNSFAVEAGSTTTVRFLCYGQNSNLIDIVAPGLIALFTPTP